MNNDPPPPGDPHPAHSGTITVEVSDTQSHLRINREEIVDLVRVALQLEGIRAASISVALVDDAMIRTINRDHLGHDYATDVISFVLNDPDLEPELVGELVISGEMAANTAHESGVKPLDELALYVVHGLLHLCGYDDLEPEAATRMRRREGEVLAAAGRTNTFVAVEAVCREVAPWAS